MAASPRTMAQGFQSHLEREDRVARLRTYARYINALLLVLLLLSILGTLRLSMPTLEPFHLPFPPIFFALVYFLLAFNIAVIVVDIVELRWLSDARLKVWRSEDFMANARPIVVIVLIIAILFGNPTVTGLIEDLSVSDRDVPIEARSSYRVNFQPSDPLDLSFIAPMEVRAVGANITVIVIEEKYYDTLEEYDFDVNNPEVEQNITVALENVSVATVDLEGVKLDNDELALVFHNPTNANITVHYRLRHELSRPMFGGLVLSCLVFFGLNLGWAVGLYMVRRRFISDFVRKEQLRLMRNYTIEEVFLIYRDGRLICHNTRRLKPDMDKDVLTGMLTAVQNFVKDSFSEEKGHLNELKYGNMKILMENGPRANLAVVITGVEPTTLRANMKNLLDNINKKYFGILDDWDGDIGTLRDLKKFIGQLIPEERQRLRGVVEEVMLLYRDNRFMMHVSQRGQPDVDDTLLSHMLETVRQKVGECTSSLENTAVTEIPYGNWKISLEYGVQCYLAVLVSGPEPPDLRPRMRQALEDITTGFENVLVNWDGGTQRILDLRIILESLFAESLTKGKKKKN